MSMGVHSSWCSWNRGIWLEHLVVVVRTEVYLWGHAVYFENPSFVLTLNWNLAWW